MAKIVVRQRPESNVEDAIKLCPFGAIESVDGKLTINSGCKMCGICVKQGPSGDFTLEEDALPQIDKTLWKGIAVYVDHEEGNIHPVTLELIGKARELAGKIGYPVYCVFIGYGTMDKAQELLHYGVDEVFVYDANELQHFRIEPYTAALEDFIQAIKPAIVLIGGTPVGRALAPRAAARFGTGLTADCTVLDMDENSNLAQIRPAFGGNIMAHIYTPNHRPQFATVRYKVFSAPVREEQVHGKVSRRQIEKEKMTSRIHVLDVRKKEKVKSIEEAEIIVVAGSAVKRAKDMELIHELAEKIGGMVAVTRPLIEAGMAEARMQIGLSGRTVQPRLIIACGVSGAIQFVAGMNKAETIVAINKDEKAAIFQVAHYGIVGDIYEIIPKMIERL